MNGGAVISREATKEKLFFVTPQTFPRFSILDPETTYTLPPRQTANGIVDAFVHTIEQYLTYPADAPLQDRQAEAILLTLIEEGPKALAEPRNYAVRANLMWCATQALNGLIGCGVPQDWATHMIGHELTALYGIDHAQSLAVVLPGMLQHQQQPQAGEAAPICRARLGHSRRRRGRPRRRRPSRRPSSSSARWASARGWPTTTFPTKRSRSVAARLAKRGMKLGEHGDLGEKEVKEILALRE